MPFVLVESEDISTIEAVVLLSIPEDKDMNEAAEETPYVEMILLLIRGVLVPAFSETCPEDESIVYESADDGMADGALLPIDDAGSVEEIVPAKPDEIPLVESVSLLVFSGVISEDELEKAEETSLFINMLLPVDKEKGADMELLFEVVPLLAIPEVCPGSEFVVLDGVEDNTEKETLMPVDEYISAEGTILAEPRSDMNVAVPELFPIERLVKPEEIGVPEDTELPSDAIVPAE